MGHFRRNEQASRKLTECQKKLWIEVRWNSTYNMLQRLLEQRRAVNVYGVEHGVIKTLGILC